MPARPARPEPRRASEVGSGTLVEEAVLQMVYLDPSRIVANEDSGDPAGIRCAVKREVLRVAVAVAEVPRGRVSDRSER